MEQHTWAEGSYNGDFLCVRSYSGRGMIGADPDGAEHLLAPNADNQSVGQAIVNALSRSRQLSPDEAHVFFDRTCLQERYTAWVTRLMSRYGYKTRRALFRHMRSCSIDSTEGVVTIIPSCHEKLEAWSGAGISKADYVRVPADRPVQEIGAALRLAFERCRE